MTDSNTTSVTAIPRNLLSEAKTIAVSRLSKIKFEDLNQLTHLLLVPLYKTDPSMNVPSFTDLNKFWQGLILVHI